MRTSTPEKTTAAQPPTKQNLRERSLVGLFLWCACASLSESEPPASPTSQSSPTVVISMPAPSEPTKDERALLELTIRIDSYIKVGNLLEPPEASAYPHLKEALGRFPEDAEVKRLKILFVEALTKELDTFIQQEKFSKATSALAILQELGADEATLKEKRAALQEEMTSSPVDTPTEKKPKEASSGEKAGEAATEYKLGSEELSKGNTSEAKNHFNKALKLDPNYSSARLGLARVAFQEGDHTLAIKHANEVLKRSPSNVEAWVLLGDARFRSYDYQSALEAYQKALAISPGSTQAQRGEKSAKKALNIN